MNRRTLYYPDVVRQFYVNLKLEGSSVLCGVFSTYIDGHRILVTPKLLASVLNLPSFGFSLFCEAEFPKVSFDPSPVLSCWTGIPLQSPALIEVAALPDALPLDLSCLMFAAMVEHSDPRCTDKFPFAPEISHLVDALGVRLDHKYLSEKPFEVPIPLNVLQSLGSRRVKGSGGDTVQSLDDLADDVCYDLVLSDDCLDESSLVPGPMSEV
ncbi:hypothetical protein LINGRAPRIM_LOCUS654 [Linum grandiflorum]